MLWEQILDEGYDEVVYIPMSNGLSSSCDTAKMLAKDYDGKVFVVDNHRIPVPQRYSVLDALALARQDASGQEIQKELEHTGLESIIYVGVETLQYLKRGGRIRPQRRPWVLSWGSSHFSSLKETSWMHAPKFRGTANCKKLLFQYLERAAEEYARKGIPFQAAAAGSFLKEKDAEEWKNCCQILFPAQTSHYDPLTCSVGCHVGPGAFGMAIVRRLTL